MEFSSPAFIFVFLPVSLVIYYLFSLINIPKRSKLQIQNIVLLILSFVFYLWGGFQAFSILIILSLFNYFSGIIIGKISTSSAGPLKGKIAFIFAVSANVFILILFKYFNMFFNMIGILTSGNSSHEMLFSLLSFENSVSGTLQIQQLVMPLAISFIVFQSISYLVDVFTKKVTAEKNVINYFLYISFFPQMTQGPIMRYGCLGPQIEERDSSLDSFASGVKRFCYGLGKKVLIANTLSQSANLIWSKDPSLLLTSEAWLGLILYTLQIYYDFSGYSDMAIGIGKMFGFTLNENFNYPYVSLSVQEFWRRWHMTLSSWFRDYIYIPLGGSRKGLLRTLLNLFIVFFITGLWHGANLTFIVWGLYFAIISIIERLFLGKLLKKNPFKSVNWIYTIFIVSIGWVFFRSQNLYYSFEFLKVLFGNSTAANASVLSYFNADLVIALVCGIALSGIIQLPLKLLYEQNKGKKVITFFNVIVPIIILVLSLFMIFEGTYNPSIYMAF